LLNHTSGLPNFTTSQGFVDDTGAGVTAAAADRLYEPFFTTKPDGMGMGLSICRSIVESHGGHLTAISDAKHGSIFRIDLPKYGSSAHEG
jgi:signal transduction histidine kinase